MNTDRERSILKILVHDKKVTVKDLSTRLFTSEPSIRRDLVSLERQHLLKRIYGGASALCPYLTSAILDDNDVSRQRIPFLLRELEQSQEKVTIAKKAASLVGDGAVVFLDASSSAFNLIPFLALKENITVITNGIRALMKLCEYNLRAVSTGGILLNSSCALSGEEAYATIARYNADFFFFSCRGLSDNGELTDISEAEDYIRLHMMERSKKAYLLCNSSKFSTRCFHHLCHASELSGIISEGEVPEGLGEYFL